MKWIDRARHMGEGDMLFVGDVSMTAVREALNKLQADPDSEVAAKRYKAKRVPSPDDRRQLKAVKSGKLKEKDAIIYHPNGLIYVLCGESWPDLTGFPRLKVDLRNKDEKPDSLSMVTRQVSGYRIEQPMPKHEDQSQEIDWDNMPSPF